jgi:L-seryl-tRNA(Ser) seleniumtransferase
VEPLLCRLTGAEAALVVNNNAAAVLLALSALAREKEVIVSRGELVEIGGSFRIPDIMRQSGAVLKEVGTTNRTHPSDYRQAVGPETGLFLKVHTSNFAIVGFTAELSAAELAEIGREFAIPVWRTSEAVTCSTFSRGHFRRTNGAGYVRSGTT